MSTTSSKNFTTLYSGSGSVTPQAPYGNANVVGLLSVGTDGANTVANISATGNVTASFFIGDGSQLTNLPTGTNYSNANVSAFLPTYTGNIGAGNISATGNVVTDGFFIGNFQGNISGNIVVPGLNTQVLFNNNGNAGASADFTFNDATNVMSVAGNIVATNIAGSGTAISNITGANVTGVVAQATQAATANVAAVANSVAGANVTGVVAQATQAATANVALVANSVAGANVSGVVAQAAQANTANSAVTAGTVTGNAQANITSVGTLTSLSVSGNITSNGNVSGNFILGNGSLLTGIASSYGNANVAAYLPTFTGNVGAGNVIATGVVYTPQVESAGDLDLNTTGKVNINGNIRVGDNNTNTQIATHGTGDLILRTHEGDANQGSITIFDGANGNIAVTPNGTGLLTTTSISATGNITTTANVAAAFFIGDGSQLTGLPASYGNANVAAYLPTYTGNVGAGNIVMTGSLPQIFIGGAQYVQGSILGAPGGYTGLFARYAGNSVTGSYVAAGVNAANQVDIKADTQEWFFGANGNITLPSNTAAINYANGVNILSGVTTTYGNANVAAYLPTYTGNIGTIGGGVAAANITNLIVNELDVGSWAISTATNDIIGTGIISTTGNVLAGNLTGTLQTANQPFITNVGTLGSLNVTADILALGNISAGGNLTTSGVLSAAGNVNASQNIVATGNITGGNLVTSGLITTSGRIQSTGNINTSSNVVATGNIATSGFFIGDGSLLTNIPGGSYGNANVAAYLPTFTGNLGAGNINLVGTENAVLGQGAGLNGSSGISTNDRLTAIGYQAGNIGNASQRSTLVGWRAGYANGGTDTVAIGRNAGNSAQGTYAVSVGAIAAATNQGLNAIAIGYNAAAANQGTSAIAIGSDSGNNQGNSSIVIGSNAGNAAVANSIVISTQGTTSTGAGLFVDPVRNDVANIGNVAMYNPTTKEFTYANTVSVAGNIRGAALTATQQSIVGLANVGTTGNIIHSGKNIATDVILNAESNVAAQHSLGRVTIGTGFNGNTAFNVLPTRLSVSDSINRSDNSVVFRELHAEPFINLTGNVTNGLFRTQAIASTLRVGGGSAANTVALSNGPGSPFAFSGGQFLIEIGNNTLYGLGNTTVSHTATNGGVIGVHTNSNLTNAFGYYSLLNIPPGSSTSGNITNYMGYTTSSISTVPVSGNVFMFYNGNSTSATARNASVGNGMRAATNYYFLMNDDDVAQVQLGSLRRYHEFESATATSGSFAIDKNLAQVHNIVPTGNCTITGYSNMVVSASDSVNNDPQVDTLKIIVEQGATPYSVTLPTGAAFKYAGNVSTVGTTANSVTIISVVAANVSGTTTYLTTVSPEFV